MGKFVDSIRKKLGLEPERKLTVTGYVPNEIIVNRNVMKESAQHSNVIRQFASIQHENWRKGFDPEGTGKERIKPNSDGTSGNINVPFDQLHPDWQKENLAAGRAALDAITRFPHPAQTEEASDHVHNEWMKRNPKGDWNAAQHVPYSQLPEVEKQKDRDHVHTMRSLLKTQMDEFAGYPYSVIPAPNVVDTNAQYVGDDSNLKTNDKKVLDNLRRRRAQKRINYVNENLDSTKPSTSATSVSIPSTHLTLTKKAKNESLFAADIPNQTGNLNQPMVQLDGPIEPVDPIIRKRKIKEDNQKEIDPDEDEVHAGLKRGTRVIIKKDGYNVRGNVDFYDSSSKKYMIALDRGSNLMVDKDDIDVMKESLVDSVMTIMERGEDSKGLYRSTEQGAGLTRKGAKHFGVKTAVTTPPSKLDPKGKAAARRRSFCARMGGMPGPMKDEKGRPTRKAMSLRRWNCEANEILIALVEAKKMKGKDPCWSDHEMIGTKQKNGRTVPNCVPKDN